MGAAETVGSSLMVQNNFIFHFSNAGAYYEHGEKRLTCENITIYLHTELKTGGLIHKKLSRDNITNISIGLST